MRGARDPMDDHTFNAAARGFQEERNGALAEAARLRRALERIAHDAEQAPMEDLLSAGKIAREALDG